MGAARAGSQLNAFTTGNPFFFTFFYTKLV